MGRSLVGLFVLVLVALVALAACGAVPLPVAGPADVSRAAVRWPGTSAGDLARGRHLYVAHCASCHSPVLPHQVAAAAWPGHIVEMKERAHLTVEEADLVTRYLVTMSSVRASR